MIAALSAALACARGEPVDTGDPASAADAGRDVATRFDAARPPDGGGGTGDAGSGEEDAGCTRKVVINELMSNGPENAEFVELYNAGTCAASIGGWKLLYRSSGNSAGPALHTFEAGESIDAKSFLVIGTDKFTGKKDATMSSGLGNNGGQVGLVDDADKLVDGVGFDDATSGDYTEKKPAPNPLANASIARKADGADSDDNAADFKTAATHSAGAANP